MGNKKVLYYIPVDQSEIDKRKIITYINNINIVETYPFEAYFELLPSIKITILTSAALYDGKQIKMIGILSCREITIDIDTAFRKTYPYLFEDICELYDGNLTGSKEKRTVDRIIYNIIFKNKKFLEYFPL